MPTKQERQLAIAVVELNDAQDGLEHASTLKTLAEQKAELERARDSIQAALDRLDRGGAIGVTVADAAEYLGVTPPTIRAWIHRGVLKRVRGKKPVQVSPDSLRRAQRLLDELRARGQDRDWLQSLVDYVHDAADRDQPGVKRGLDELRRGQTEPA